MKQKLFKTMLLLCALVAGSTSVWADTKVLTFDVSSNPGSWPTANSTTLTNYTYTLSEVDYTFGLKNVKCNPGYLMMTSTAVLGLPAIVDYKLTKVVATNSSGCSTSTKVGISSSSSSESYISGGAIQTWSTTSSSYTYNLTSTEVNTVYYLYVTNKNAQVTGLELTYEEVGGSIAAATTTTIDDSDITNTDVYTSTDAGSLSASVTVTAGGAAVPGANVTWTSSDTGVATIGETTGVVTLVAAGTTIITASYAGVVDTYQSSSATYNLTVTSSAPYVQPTEVEIALNDTFFGTSYGGSASGITDAYPESGTQDNITITYAGSGNHYINSSQIRFYPSNKLTFEAPSGYKITQIVFTSAGTWAATISANSGTYNSSTKTWTGSATSVLFTGSGSSRCDMSKATVTLAPIGTATTTTIDYSGITNKDVYTSTDAGSLSASVTAGGTPVAGATVTWSSSDTDVATIGETTGVVTLVAAGTTTITASYGGNATYDGSSDTYELTVTNSAPPTTYTLVTAITSGKHYVIANGDGDKVMGGQTSNNRTAVEATPTSSTTLSVAAGVAVREVVICGPDDAGFYTIYDEYDGPEEDPGYLYAASSSSNWLRTSKSLSDNACWNIAINGEGEATVVANGTNTHNTMRYNSSSSIFSCYETGQAAVYFYEKDGEATPKESVTVNGTYEYATYATSDNALDFTGSGIEAYIATTKGDGTGVNFTRIYKVPTYTGILLHATGGATVDIPSLTGAADDVSYNVFVPGSGAGVASETGGYYNYVLYDGDSGLGFYKANGKVVSSKKAYISVSEAYPSSVKEFIALPGMEDDADGINSIDNGELTIDNAAIYNLAGQRLSKMQKGINIVNGKKILY